jgi:hypothetical protein
MSTGQESGKEHQEIPPTPHMEQQAKQGKGGFRRDALGRTGAAGCPLQRSEQTQGCGGVHGS